MPWWTEITRYQWTVLLMTWLGFLFDLMDSTLYTMVMGPALQDLLGHCGIGAEHRLVRRTDFFDLPRRMGARRHRVRHPRRLCGPQADADDHHSDLCGVHRARRPGRFLVGARRVPLSHRPGCRRRVGGRCSDSGRDVAREGAGQGCGDPSDVGRHGIPRRGVHLSARWRLRLAPRVPGRRAPRGAPLLHSQDDSRIRTLDGNAADR